MFEFAAPSAPSKLATPASLFWRSPQEHQAVLYTGALCTNTAQAGPRAIAAISRHILICACLCSLPLPNAKPSANHDRIWSFVGACRALTRGGWHW